MAITIKKLTVILFATSFCSCVQNKYFFKNNSYNTVRQGKGGNPMDNSASTPDTLFTFKAKKGFQGKLTEMEGYSVIEPRDDSKLHPFHDSSAFTIFYKDDDPVSFNAKVGLLKDKYFIPDVMTPFTKDTLTKNPGAKETGKITYFDSKPVLQTLSTPIKIRPKLSEPELKDSFPSQVSTSVNLGMAFGWKMSLNFYKPKPNVFGLKVTTVSLTPGAFYGLGATGLTKANTRNPVIDIERSVLSHTLGGFAMLGFNNINIGYSIGWDFVTGPNKSAWLYQGKVWHGVAIALDLIK
jgi:hypothetical protein